MPGHPSEVIVSLKVALVLFAVVSLAGCGGLGFKPSTGSGAAELGVNDGFGIGPTSEGPYGSALGFYTLGRNGR